VKSRIIGNMIDFLDEEMTIIDGYTISDNPFDPICGDCRRRCVEQGDDLSPEQ